MGSRIRIGFIASGAQIKIEKDEQVPAWLSRGVDLLRKEFPNISLDTSVLADIALGAYIAVTYDQANVVLNSPPDSIDTNPENNHVQSFNRARGIDVTYVIWDHLEALHQIGRAASNEFLKEMQNAQRNLTTFVCPHPDAQLYMRNKSNYYSVLRDHGVPVVRHFELTNLFKDESSLVTEFREQCNQLKMSKVILKPAGGCYSVGIKVVDVTQVTDDDLGTIFKRLRRRFGMCTVQSFVPSVKDNFEFRTYWVRKNDSTFKYLYTVGTKSNIEADDDPGLPISMYASFEDEGGKVSLQTKKHILKVANQALRALRDQRTHVVLQQPMLRIDIACCYDGGYFVNEIEMCNANRLQPLSKELLWKTIKKIGDAFYTFAVEQAHALRIRRFLRPLGCETQNKNVVRMSVWKGNVINASVIDTSLIVATRSGIMRLVPTDSLQREEEDLRVLHQHGFAPAVQTEVLLIGDGRVGMLELRKLGSKSVAQLMATPNMKNEQVTDMINKVVRLVKRFQTRDGFDFHTRFWHLGHLAHDAHGELKLVGCTRVRTRVRPEDWLRKQLLFIMHHTVRTDDVLLPRVQSLIWHFTSTFSTMFEYRDGSLASLRKFYDFSRPHKRPTRTITRSLCAELKRTMDDA